MYLMVCFCGAASGGLATGMLMASPRQVPATWAPAEGQSGDDVRDAPGSKIPLLTGVAIGFLYAATFLTTYYAMVLNATSEEKLVKASR